MVRPSASRMKKPLQDFDWKKSQYERPTHGWVCGRLCDGSACDLGPTSRGKCPEEAACRPRRGLMRKRWLLTATCFLASLAACFGMFGGSTPTQSVSPGEVAEHHATIKHDCERCHTAAERGVNWLSCIGNSDIVKNDIQKCIECHHGQGFTAHGLAPDQLRSLTQRAKQRDVTSGSTPLLVNIASRLQGFSPEKNVACSACHHEHRGRDFDLTQMSNQQCQTCHQRQFHSFTDGHPPFQDFPYERRTRINFDHARHLGKYFENEEFGRLMPNGIADKSCESCHEMSHDGVMVLTNGYDTMCRSCHEAEIVDEEFPGIPMFALRDLSNAKNDKGDPAEIGEWPSVFADPPLKDVPPFMSLLLTLSRNKAGALGKPFKDDEEYAWQTKRLFHAIEHDLPGLELNRVPYFGVDVHSSFVAAVQQSNRIWFPNLADELKAREANATPPINSSKLDKPNFWEPKHVRGWYVRESDRTIRYRPSGHADAVVKSLLDSVTRDAPPGTSNPLTNEFVDMLMSPTASGSRTSQPVASGRCLMCHSVDGPAMTPKGASPINWRAAHPTATKRLTRFSHAPHVRTLHIEGCRSCHQLSDEPREANAIFRSNYFFKEADTNWSPRRRISEDTGLSSGFASISEAKCMKCHNETGVGQGCLKCHNYHTRSSTTEHDFHH